MSQRDSRPQSQLSQQQNSQQNFNQSQQQQQQQQNIPQTQFQSLPLRDYYDSSVTKVLLEGLKEIGRQRPDNPIQFLGKFLLDNDPEK